MLEELLPFAEYGAFGLMAAALYLIARMYHPQFAELAQGLRALPAALQALQEALTTQGKDLREGLADVGERLAVIQDRLPRHGEPVAPTVPSERDKLLDELLAARVRRLQQRQPSAGD